MTTRDANLGRRLLATSLATLSFATSFACAQREAAPVAKPPAAASQPATSPASQPTSKPAVPFLKEIEAFERKDAEQMPAPGGLLFYGSSTIRLWDTKAGFPELPTINRGFGGSQMSDALRFADRAAFKYQPKVVVLYEGDNDLAAGKTPELIIGQIKDFAGQLHAKVPAAKLVLLPAKPSPSRAKLKAKYDALNQMQREYAEQNAAWATFVDTATLLLDAEGNPRPGLYREDKLHMAPAGYALWNDALRPTLTKLMGE